MKKILCNNGTCTGCGGEVVWVKEGGRWRLFDAGPEHECQAGGYRASLRAARRAGQTERAEEVDAALVDQLRSTKGAGGNR